MFTVYRVPESLHINFIRITVEIHQGVSQYFIPLILCPTQFVPDCLEPYIDLDNLDKGMQAINQYL